MGAGQDHPRWPGPAARPGLQRLSGLQQVDVAPERIARWIDGFVSRHGETTWSLDGTSYLLTGADAAWARLTSWTSANLIPPDLPTWSTPPTRIGLILIRRGGYAVGVADTGTLVAHKTGTRYVQSRTAAGGWSQQRYARRRGNQADALVQVVAERSCSMFAQWPPKVLVIGGDKALAAQVASDDLLKPFAQLATREFYDIADPRFAVLTDVVKRARAVHATVSNMVASSEAPET